MDPDRYEFMVYLQLMKEITDGTVFIRNSNSYRALEDELIDPEVWARDKDKILAELNMPLLKLDIVNLLAVMEKSLEEKYRVVNQRISKGENTGLKIKYNRNGDLVKWTLPYVRSVSGVNNPFFKELPISSIGDIMRFVAEETCYIKAFTHIQPRQAKTSPNQEALHAYIVASATGLDPDKMREISDVEEKDLENMRNNFTRKQTLSAASDMIINRMKELPIFSEYNLADYGVHASVDGQKLGTKFNTIKSRHSKKYFGLLKGIVLYSLNANHLPLCLKVIGANEHESHFLLDIVESNTTEVEISAISGDMHSINRVNFALLHLFGYRFMPRFTRLNDKTETNLVGFQDGPKYDKYVIKPAAKVDKGLIVQEWDNVLRILASLAQKKTTQSQIVRKLSVYKKNPTLKALIEFDRIIMSDYMLDYIDSAEVRSVVQASLCRGESYHQLSSTIAKVSGGKQLSGKTKLNWTSTQNPSGY